MKTPLRSVLAGATVFACSLFFCAFAAAALRTPPTEAEKEHGRTLPTPELLQPTLDVALPAFEPKRGCRCSRGRSPRVT